MRDEVQQPQKPGPEPAQKPKETQPHAERPRHLGLVAICALLALAGLIAFGVWGHAQRSTAAADTQKQQEEASAGGPRRACRQHGRATRARPPG